MKLFLPLLFLMAAAAFAEPSRFCHSYQAQGDGSFKKLYVRLATKPSELPALPGVSFGQIGILATSYDNFGGSFNSSQQIDVKTILDVSNSDFKIATALVKGDFNCPDCDFRNTPYGSMTATEELREIRKIAIFSTSSDWQKASSSHGAINGMIDVTFLDGSILSFIYAKDFTLVGRCLNQ